jgi:hypothetical protein
VDRETITDDYADFPVIFEKTDGMTAILSGFARKLFTTTLQAITRKVVKNLIAISCSVSLPLHGFFDALTTALSSTRIAVSACFEIELECVIESFQFSETAVTPFYSLRVVPICRFLDHILSSRSTYIDMISFAKSGISDSISLFTAGRVCKKQLTHPYVILVESDAVLMDGLQEFYERAS